MTDAERKQQPQPYPADFIAEVKAVFPDWEKLHQALEAGSDFVGRYLDDSRGLGMNPDEIVQAFEDGNQEAVLEKAKRAKTIADLYSKWGQLR